MCADSMMHFFQSYFTLGCVSKSRSFGPRIADRPTGAITIKNDEASEERLIVIV